MSFCSFPNDFIDLVDIRSNIRQTILVLSRIARRKQSNKNVFGRGYKTVFNSKSILKKLSLTPAKSDLFSSFWWLCITSMRRFMLRIITIVIPRGNNLTNRCYSFFFCSTNVYFVLNVWRIITAEPVVFDRHNIETNGCRADSTFSAIYDLKPGSVTFSVSKAKKFNYAFLRVITWICFKQIYIIIFSLYTISIFKQFMLFTRGSHKITYAGRGLPTPGLEYRVFQMFQSIEIMVRVDDLQVDNRSTV